MLESIAYYVILGKPLIYVTGIAALLSFLFTASIAILNRRGITAIPFKWHPRFAALSIALAIMHGALGILVYL